MYLPISPPVLVKALNAKCDDTTGWYCEDGLFQCRLPFLASWLSQRLLPRTIREGDLCSHCMGHGTGAEANETAAAFEVIRRPFRVCHPTDSDLLVVRA